VSLPRPLLLPLVVAVAVAVAVAVVVATVVVVGVRPDDEAPVRQAGGTAPGEEAPALAVLRAWDVRRAAAWAMGDEEALRRLYTPDSAAGRRDVLMLRSWVERGLRVRGMRMQVLAVRVRQQRTDRVVLLVTDRLAGAVATGRGLRTVLPRDAASTRVLTLRLLGGSWRMGSVRTQASPARRTSATSRSSNS
jgi:acetyl esterase/lipase